MVIVRFLKNSSPYAAGETAGFEDSHAKLLIAQRIAEEVKQPAKK